MNTSHACTTGLAPSLDDEEALLAWVREALASRSGQVAEGEERRLLQLLHRLRPALQQAMAACGATEFPDAETSAAAFEAALAQCGGHD